MATLFSISQQGEAWHRQGLYMGMHWAWWLFWLAVVAVVAWAFWRLAAERREARDRTRNILAAEETLRRRFARGDIDKAELTDELRALRGTREADDRRGTEP